jgi:hypothetical protein
MGPPLSEWWFLMARLVLRIAVVLALALGPQIALAQAPRQQRVSFKPGTASATLNGSITAQESIDYVLGARAGQTMTVAFKATNGASSYNVLPPGSEAAIAIGETVGPTWSGTLPVDGDYRVRVFLQRSAGRRGESTSFTLTVGITGTAARGVSATGATTGDAVVAGTPYHATGHVPCSVGTDARGSSQCSFGVIRRSSGEADVYLADPGFDVTIHKTQLRILKFVGARVTSANATEKVTAERRGDEWLVSVNGFRYYTIPDAVIVGG